MISFKAKHKTQEIKLTNVANDLIEGDRNLKKVVFIQMREIRQGIYRGRGEKH